MWSISMKTMKDLNSIQYIILRQPVICDTGSGSVYYSESFVVAALDTAGNISPLSNPLGTIYTTVQIDTCNKRVEVKWNSYSSVPKEVTDYWVYYSVNGGSFTDSLKTGPGITNLALEDFIVDAHYCFLVKASLSGGLQSGSNIACLQTKMQRPPEWINADYASVVTDQDIMLSFTPDPDSEIGHYSLEKRTGADGQFEQIYDFANISGRTLYADSKADVNKVNFYRLKAINNCNQVVPAPTLHRILFCQQARMKKRLIYHGIHTGAGEA